MSGRAALRVPVRLSAPRDTIVATAPWFVRTAGPEPKGATSPPALSTMVDDDFVPAYFRSVEASPVGWTPGAWRPLRAFRDWAEPPSGMLDASRRPRYDAGSVARVAPASGAVEPDADAAAAGLSPVSYAERTEWRRDPAARQRPGSPNPWLRKLYLPLHGHFQVVSCGFECDRAARPRLDPKRLTEAGAVVRRLRPLPDRGGRWEDWIVGEDGRGAWVEVADADMKPTAGAPLLDPAAVPPAAVGDLDAQTRLRLGLGLKADAPLRLGTTRLARFPVGLGAAADHTAVFGYLPVTSDATQAQTPVEDPSLWQGMVDAMARQATSHLEGLVLAEQAGLQATLFADLRTLAEKLLPPSTLADEAARLAAFDLVAGNTDFDGAGVVNLGGLPVSSPVLAAREGRLTTAVSQVAYRTLRLLWQTADPPAPPAYTARAVRPAAWWSGAYVGGRDEYLGTLPGSGGSSAADALWLRWTLENRRQAEFEQLVLYAIWELLAADAAPGEPGGVLPVATRRTYRLIVVLMRRLRAVRAELCDAIHRTILPEYDPSTLLRLRTDTGAPIFTTSSASAEITGWLHAEGDRDRYPRDWPVLPQGLVAGATKDYFDELAAVHAAAVVLEDRLAELERVSGQAGSAFAEMVEARLRLLETTLEPWVGVLEVGLATPWPAGRVLRGRGVDLREQPLRGLLAWPTFNPMAVVSSGVTWLARTIEVVGEAYEALLPPAFDPGSLPAAPTLRPLKVELKRRAETPLPRFDSNSIYAVWCYAKVAGRTPCEEGQLVWSRRTEPFTIADPQDLLGLRPTTIQLPDLNRMMRDIPRIPKAGALPMAAVLAAPNSGISVGEEPEDTARSWGVELVCSFGIPVFTICAWILFRIILSILLLIPGFAWLLLLKFCIPIPKEK